MNYRNKLNLNILKLVVVITVITNIIMFTAAYFIFFNNNVNGGNVITTNSYIDNVSTKQVNVVDKVKNGVVTVINRTKVSTYGSSGNLDDFFNWYNDNNSGNNNSQSRVVDNAIGSGFVIKNTGDKYYIMTNNHVIEGASEVEIMFSDKTRVKADLVGRMPNKDVAVLKINTNKKLTTLSFADSKKIKLGEDVIAIGSPLSTDYQQTVTKGIVSKLPFVQKIDEYDERNALQTDAAINPGNSGGPLFNLQGHVIGMNTFKREDGESLGFSMPSNDIKNWANHILKNGNK